MAEHPNVERFRQAVAARSQATPGPDDTAAVDDLFAEGVVWHGAPDGADASGRDAVAGLWNAYARGEFGGPTIAVKRVYADATHGVTEVEVAAPGGNLSVLQALVYELDGDGKVTGIWGMPADADIVAAFAKGELPAPHPHQELFEVAEDVRARQSFEPDDMAVLERFLDKGVIWHGAGRSQFKDGARPRENVIALYKLFKQFSNGTFAMHYSGMYTGDDHAVSFVKLTADIGPKHMDFDEVNLFHLHPDGSTYEFWGIAEDQEAVDRFWDPE
ncbi:MAG TPA: nuclear transport factor 2 family protein [Acidimicrobiales bacterium]|jgi:hypothetical protein|nr:nuclear transport factor 2 family protein [Acidimicrobiales bacterium]